MYLALLPALFFGWSLGANDASNVFGTTVSNGIVRFRVATLISAGFILLGAFVGGSRGLKTISELSSQTIWTASIASLAAAISVTLMTRIGLPVSSSQAMVGAILGIGLIRGSVDWIILLKVVLCWVGTPIGGMFFGFIGYKFFATFFHKIKSVQVQDASLKLSAIIIGAYGSYALGANNVGNVTGIFADIIPLEIAALLGGLSIGLGVLTYSKRVMMTVGKEIVALDSFSSVIAVFGEAVTVWIYALIGVPVSTSQAIVGSVMGVGYARGSRTFNLRSLKRILFGWLETPFISGLISAGMFLVLRYFFQF
ncbi:MAG: anion permease [Kosmotogaceae bacterium]